MEVWTHNQEEQFEYEQKTVTIIVEGHVLRPDPFLENVPNGMIAVVPHDDKTHIIVDARNPGVVRNFQLELGFQPDQAKEFYAYIFAKFRIREEDTTQPREEKITRTFTDSSGILRERVIRVTKSGGFAEELGKFAEVFVLEDISHRVQLERRYEAFFETLKQWACVISPEGIIKELHQNRESVTSGLNLISENIFDFYRQNTTAELAEAFADQLSKAIRTEEVINEIYYHETENGMMVYSVNIRKINDQELAVISQNITDHHQALEEMVALMENLQIKGREVQLAHQSIHDMKLGIFGVNHDIRGSLQSMIFAADFIRRFAGNLLQNTDGGDQIIIAKILEQADIITRKTKWAGELISTLQYIANLDPTMLELGNIDVNNLIKSIDSGDDRKLITEFQMAEMFIMSDGRFVGQILQNLIGNAFKYSKSDVTVRTSTDSKVVRIGIEDRGIGIAEKDAEKVWDLFGRTEEARGSKVEGTGVGLAVVKRTVELLRGKVWFESVVGEGTTFFVELPTNLEP